MRSTIRRPDIIILHGWNLSGSRFRALADVFEKAGHRVYTPDLPGFGGEKAPNKPWHVVDYAEFLKTFLDAHRIRQPVIIGHSFGGRVALKFSQIYPESVSRIILTGTPGFSPVPTGKLWAFLAISKVGGLLFALPVLHVFADRARRFLYYVAGAREFIRAEGVMRDTFKHIVRDDLTVSMETLHLPCLLVWGEFDTIVPLSIARRMEESIPGARLKVIPESDHAVPFKQPEIFASYVTEFLSA